MPISTISTSPQVGVRPQPSATFFLHVAMATAVFAIAEIQFIPRPVAIGIGLCVAVLGILLFGIRSRPLLWAFPLAMMATVFWSPDPKFTFISLGLIVVPVLLAGVVVRVCGPDRFIRSLALWARIALMLSFALFFLRPDLGAQHDALYEGAMRGLFAHKNGLARILVIGVFAEMVISQRASSRVFWLGVFLAAALLTKSTSFFVLVCGVIILLTILRAVNWKSSQSVLLFIAFAHVVAAISLVVVVKFVPGWIASSDRFSGEDDRGRIWSGVMALFEMKPLGGWGYGQVFKLDTTAGQLLWQFIGWTPPAAHSGYMDAIVEGGLLGLSALVITFLVALGVTWKARAVMVWPLVYVVVIAANNVTDSRSGSLEWFIFAAGILYATGQKRRHKYLLMEPETSRRKGAPPPLGRKTAHPLAGNPV